MIRLLVRTLIALVANAVGLIVAAAVLDDMQLDATSFVVAVVIFTIVFALLQPFLVVQLRRVGSGVIGAVALIATLVSLIVTDLLTDGLSISGVTTWILAALIVWLAALVAALLLPFLGLKKYLERAPGLGQVSGSALGTHEGRRRSRNARSPSCPSSLVRRSAIRRAVSGPSGRSSTSRFAWRAARGPAVSSSRKHARDAAVEVADDLVHETDAQRRLAHRSARP